MSSALKLGFSVCAEGIWGRRAYLEFKDLFYFVYLSFRERCLFFMPRKVSEKISRFHKCSGLSFAIADICKTLWP